MADKNLEKYQNKNLLQRMLIRRFFERMDELFATISNPMTALEVGCGEGFLLHRLKRGFPHVQFQGIDPDEQALMYALQKDPAVPLQKGNIYHLPFADDTFDVVVCSEVLEHLERPEKGLEELTRVSKRYLLLTVPHEPWFRLCNLLRGRNIRRLGNHPFHLQTWTRQGFVEFVATKLHVQCSVTSFPWTLVLAAKQNL